MKHPFFTIGHSTRSIEEFVDLLRVAKVQLVADVRTVPRSRTNPQFSQQRSQNLRLITNISQRSEVYGPVVPRYPDPRMAFGKFWLPQLR